MVYCDVSIFIVYVTRDSFRKNLHFFIKALSVYTLFITSLLVFCLENFMNLLVDLLQPLFICSEKIC